jgi:hypothetical protein
MRSPSELAGTRRTDYSDAWALLPQRQRGFVPIPTVLITSMIQRSPINVVLLAVATLALNAVAITWLARASARSEAAYLYEGLATAQLALVCLWAVFAARHAWSGWLVTIVAVVVVAAVTSHILTESTFAEELGSDGSEIALLAMALWVLKRTEFWQRRTGSDPVVWQYSITFLLGIMTLVAVLVVSLRHTQLLVDWWQPLAALIVGDVVVAVATTVLWAGKEHIVTRLAATCAAAIVVGLCEAPAQVQTTVPAPPTGFSRFQLWVEMAAYSLIVALVMFIWLELVPIVPISRPAESAPESQT